MNFTGKIPKEFWLVSFHIGLPPQGAVSGVKRDIPGSDGGPVWRSPAFGGEGAAPESACVAALGARHALRTKVDESS